MPPALHAAASSSGVAAPSRKLNADRACSSTYISRRPRARTSRGAPRRNTRGTSRHREALRLRRPLGEPPETDEPADESESPGPIHPAATRLRATNRPTCARDPRRPARLLAALEKTRVWDGPRAAPAMRAAEDETFESSPAF